MVDWAGEDMELRVRLPISQPRSSPTSSIRMYIVFGVRAATEGAPTPATRYILMADRILSFAPVTSDIVCRMVT